MRRVRLFVISLMLILGLLPGNSYGTDNSFIIFKITQDNISDWKKVLANPEFIKFVDSSKVDILPVFTVMDPGSVSNNISERFASIALIFNYLQWHQSRKTALQFLEYGLDLLPTGKVDGPDELGPNMEKKINAWLEEHKLPAYAETVKIYTPFLMPEMAAQGKLFQKLVETLTPEENKAMNELDKNKKIPVLSVCFINDKLEYDCLRKKFISK